jgi:hypothetical protein
MRRERNRRTLMITVVVCSVGSPCGPSGVLPEAWGFVAEDEEDEFDGTPVKPDFLEWACVNGIAWMELPEAGRLDADCGGDAVDADTDEPGLLRWAYVNRSA